MCGNVSSRGPVKMSIWRPTPNSVAPLGRELDTECLVEPLIPVIT